MLQFRAELYPLQVISPDHPCLSQLLSLTAQVHFSFTAVITICMNFVCLIISCLFPQRECRLIKSGSALNQCGPSIDQRARHSKCSVNSCWINEDYPGDRWRCRELDLVISNDPFWPKPVLFWTYCSQLDLIGSFVVINLGIIQLAFPKHWASSSHSFWL